MRDNDVIGYFITSPDGRCVVVCTDCESLKYFVGNKREPIKRVDASDEDSWRLCSCCSERLIDVGGNRQ